MTKVISQSLPLDDYKGHDNLDAMAGMERYNQWIYDSIAPYLGHEILEAGCGNGNITKWILQSDTIRRYKGIDLSEPYCRQLAQRFKPGPGMDVTFQCLDLEQASLASLASAPFDSIVCLNVLEHIRDDARQLGFFYEMLKPGGRLVLQVPAFQWLYGTIDVADQHFRRYTKRLLSQLVLQTGFEIANTYYFNMLGIPAWVWHGKIRKLHTHPKQEVVLLDRAVPLCRALESFIKPPFGLAVFMVARKPLT